MKMIGVVAMLMALAVSAGAGDSRGFRISTPLIYSAAAGADLWTTEKVLALPGGVEHNPLGQKLSYRIGLKVAMVVGASIADTSLRKQGHPKAANIMRVAIVLAHIGVAAHNFRESQR